MTDIKRVISETITKYLNRRDVKNSNMIKYYKCYLQEIDPFTQNLEIVLLDLPTTHIKKFEMMIVSDHFKTEQQYYNHELSDINIIMDTMFKFIFTMYDGNKFELGSKFTYRGYYDMEYWNNICPQPHVTKHSHNIYWNETSLCSLNTKKFSMDHWRNLAYPYFIREMYV